jgi:predicted molibdopterin-dependent oxidoreductase YjgC
MSSPGPLLHPYEKLVKITIMDKDFMVPENNTLLRGFQFLAPDGISYGRFCWNEDCQYCRVTYDNGEGTPIRKAISCKLMVEDGMRILEAANEIKYCLRDLQLASATPK